MAIDYENFDSHDSHDSYDSYDNGLSWHNTLMQKAILRSSDALTQLITLMRTSFYKREKPSLSVRASELLETPLVHWLLRITDSSDSVNTSPGVQHVR